MNRFIAFNRKINVSIAAGVLLAILVGMVIVSFKLPKYVSGIIYSVQYKGEEIGVVSEVSELNEAVLESRAKLAKESDGLTLLELDLEVIEKEVDFYKIDTLERLKEKLYNIMKDTQIKTLEHAYTIKINDFTVNLSSAQEIEQLLNGTLDEYDTSGEFSVNLELDEKRQFNVLTAKVKSKYSEIEVTTSAGLQSIFDEVDKEIEESRIKDFEDYELGIDNMYFGNEIEIAEAYLKPEHMSDVSTTIETITKKMEKEEIYKVVSGDTLSEISITTDVPLDKLIELNDALEDERSIINIGQELIVTVPEPELSVMKVEREYVEEDYEAEIIYVPNDKWYTTEKKVLQQPSSGRRILIADNIYENDKVVDREIVKEELLVEAVPKIVERGTIIPPTFIKPISGGRLTSPFGPRRAPKPGASTYHGGIDWGTPTGTTVYASSGGVVVKSGWVGSYGYVIYINHPNGMQTRYAHCSRLLVREGTYVSQGDVIARTGNTGVSTGPHIHFEMRLHGVRVNPATYL